MWLYHRKFAVYVLWVSLVLVKSDALCLNGRPGVRLGSKVSTVKFGSPHGRVARFHALPKKTGECSPWALKSAANSTCTCTEDRSSILTSSSAVDVDSSITRGSNERVGVPGYGDVLKFVSCTILIWLSEPLLSLVDTLMVGRLASVSELAALGPSTLICDNALYATYFLSIATTVQMARARASSRSLHNQRSTAKSALTLAAIAGTVLTLLLSTQGHSMLSRILSTNSHQLSGLATVAHSYVKIRGAVAVFSVCGMIAQSICLATLDTRTPAKAVLLASFLNILLDYTFIPSMGLPGAALATAIASLASSLLLLNEIYTKYTRHWNTNTNIPTPANHPTDSSNSHHNTSTSSVQSLLQFITLAGPISLVIWGKMIAYSSMTLQATALGTISTLACHNILLRIFFFFCTFGDALSQGIQSFLPPFLPTTTTTTANGTGTNANVNTNTNTNQNENDHPYEETSNMPKYQHILQFQPQSDIITTNNTIRPKLKSYIRCIQHKYHQPFMKRLKQITNKNWVPLIKKFIVISMGMGLINAQISNGIITYASHLLTNDVTVLNLLKQHVGWLAGAVVLHPLVMTLEGILLATGRGVYPLLASYGISVSFLYSIVSASKSLTHVWKSLFAFQCIRTLTFLTSFLFLPKERKKNKQTNKANS